MSSERWFELKRLFFEALELPASERTAFLDQSGADQTMVDEIEELLRAEAETSPILDQNIGHFDALFDAIEDDAFIGKQVDSYRILHKIGQGGMGAVYLAEQKEESFHRFVAIKVIRKGMDSRQVIRRFNTERQILAALDHPNIARLLDGGASKDGISYLAMEYIDGMPITEYCDSRKLSVRERMLLFQDVCAAVHYAHQNLVVHRDLKPSNILVTNKGTIKLLDFGIAKLLNPNLTPQGAVITQAAHRLMTPEYASPEQVRGESVTTGSDVYALGVLLYELLTGHRPFRFTSRIQEEIYRIICEKEPTRPSTVVGQIVEGPAGSETKTLTPELVSEARGTVADRLRRQLHGDLDNIVLMAMRKEPQRRYSSAENLARDIDRHLSGNPVLARSPTLMYRTQKFVQRHPFGITASAAFVVLFATFAFLYTVQLRQERDRAQQSAQQAERVTDFMLSVFQGSNPFETQGDTITARELLNQGVVRIEDELTDQPLIQARLYDAMGLSYESLGQNEHAQTLFSRAFDLRREHLPPVDLELAQSYFYQAELDFKFRRYEDGEENARKSLEIRQTLLGATHEKTLESMHVLAKNLSQLKGFQEADSLLHFVLTHQRSLLGRTHPLTLETLYNLGTVLHGLQRHDEAKALLEETLEGFDPNSTEVTPSSAYSLMRLARLTQFQNEHARAEELYRTVLLINEQLYDAPHIQLTNTRKSIATTLKWQKKDREALSVLFTAMSESKQLYGERSNQVAILWDEVADSYEMLAEYDSALSALREIETIYAQTEPARKEMRGKLLVNMAKIYRTLGQTVKARSLARAALDSLRGQEGILSQTQIAYAHKVIGLIEYNQKMYENAETSLRTSHEILRQYWSRSPNLEFAEVNLYLGSALRYLHRYDEAETFLQNADSTFSKLVSGVSNSSGISRLQQRTQDELEALSANRDGQSDNGSHH